MDMLPYESIILLVMMFVTIFLIYKTYQTPLDGKTFIINIYLYVIVALLFIAFAGRYTQLSGITDAENMWKMMILYLILGCIGISLMMNDTMVINHIGYLLMLLALSLIIGVSYKYSTNVSQAAAITAVIVIILTVIVAATSEENLIKMKEWLPNLTIILCCIILMEFGYIMFFDQNKTVSSLISMTVIVLFIFFILSDTSRLLLESKNLPCKVHTCINYPIRASSLVLDYINIFVNLLNGSS